MMTRQAIICGSDVNLRKKAITTIKVWASEITLSKTVRDLGLFIDKKISMAVVVRPSFPRMTTSTSRFVASLVAYQSYAGPEGSVAGTADKRCGRGVWQRLAGLLGFSFCSFLFGPGDSV